MMAPRRDIQIGDELEQDDPLGGEGGDRSRAISAREAWSGVDWEAIKHAYIHGDKSLKRISDEFGSSQRTIGHRAKQNGWVRLTGTKRLARGRKARLPGTPRTPRSTADQLRRRNLARRLYLIIDAKLREIETRMHQAESGAAPQSAADTERDMRNLNSVLTIYTKLVELDEKAKQAGSEKQGTVGSEDAEQLRRDLARRIERLNREGDG